MAENAYQELAVLFADGSPAGVDLRDEAHIETYRAIKTARANARAEDQSNEQVSMSEGGAAAVHAPSAHWRALHDLCTKALSSKTKDIELLGWLAEAAIKSRGLAALCDVLPAIQALVTEAPDDLFSRESDTIKERFGPLGALSGSQNYEGTIIRSLRLVSLVDGGVYGQLCLYNHDRASHSGDTEMLGPFRDAFAGLPREDDFAQRERVGAAVAALSETDRFLTERYGADAPNIENLREMLERVGQVLSELSVHGPLEAEGQSAGDEADEDAAGADAEGAAPGGAEKPMRPPGAVTTRDEAFRAMLEIAGFFRRTEPHSTIPLALETLVRRGRLDFLGLIAELVPDEKQRRDILVRAGIEPGGASDNNGGNGSG